MLIRIAGALVAGLRGYAGYWSSRWARRFPGSGILGRASWGETFKRFLPHTPSSNVRPCVRCFLMAFAAPGRGRFAVGLPALPFAGSPAAPVAQSESTRQNAARVFRHALPCSVAAGKVRNLTASALNKR